jgi:hypothetical protein
MKSDFHAIRNMASAINIRNYGDCIIGKYTFAEYRFSNGETSATLSISSGVIDPTSTMD